LFVEILMGNDDDHPTARANQAPPSGEGVEGIRHVLEAVGRPDVVEVVLHELIDPLGVPLVAIESSTTLGHGIAPTTDVEALTGQVALKAMPVTRQGLRRLVHRCRG